MFTLVFHGEKKNLRCILLISLQCRKEKSSEKVNQHEKCSLKAWKHRLRLPSQNCKCSFTLKTKIMYFKVSYCLYFTDFNTSWNNVWYVTTWNIIYTLCTTIPNKSWSRTHRKKNAKFYLKNYFAWHQAKLTQLKHTSSWKKLN